GILSARGEGYPRLRTRQRAGPDVSSGDLLSRKGNAMTYASTYDEWKTGEPEEDFEPPVSGGGAGILPIVHSNGTSRERLIEQRCEAANALQKALEALQAMCPNGRDYYPQPGLWEKAEQLHRGRMRLLAGIYNAIQAEAEALADQE